MARGERTYTVLLQQDAGTDLYFGGWVIIVDAGLHNIRANCRYRLTSEFLIECANRLSSNFVENL